MNNFLHPCRCDLCKKSRSCFLVSGSWICNSCIKEKRLDLHQELPTPTNPPISTTEESDEVVYCAEQYARLFIKPEHASTEIVKESHIKPLTFNERLLKENQELKDVIVMLTKKLHEKEVND